MKYTILKSDNPYWLACDVQTQIDNGWEPLGWMMPFFISYANGGGTEKFIQTLIRK